MRAIGPWTLTLGTPDIFAFSVGDSIDQQPAMGWQGVVKIDYKAGTMAIDTRYRWTAAERWATATFWRRLFMARPR